VYHVRCAGLKAVPRGDWFCPQCASERCGACGKGPVPADESILCGAEDPDEEGTPGGGCGAAFHLACVRLRAVPEGDWFCSSCKRARKGAA
jgi:hypothetical protein